MDVVMKRSAVDALFLFEMEHYVYGDAISLLSTRKTAKDGASFKTFVRSLVLL